MTGRWPHAISSKFLLKHVGKVVTADQLREAAGGIHEWARRVRELRDDFGYQIRTPHPGEYLLETAEPQPGSRAHPGRAALMQAIQRAHPEDQKYALVWLLKKYGAARKA